MEKKCRRRWFEGNDRFEIEELSKLKRFQFKNNTVTPKEHSKRFGGINTWMGEGGMNTYQQISINMNKDKWGQGDRI